MAIVAEPNSLWHESAEIQSLDYLSLKRNWSRSDVISKLKQHRQSDIIGHDRAGK
jgi:hypothetical protein